MADTSVTLSEWVIDDDIPYIPEFPLLYDITEYSDDIWFVDDDIPYIPAFSAMYEFTDTPSGVWCIKDSLPYMEEFPKMYGFTDAPDDIWMVQNADGEFYNSPFLNSFNDVSRPRRERNPNYVTYNIVLDMNYSDKVVVNMMSLQPIVLESYECNIVTEEL